MNMRIYSLVMAGTLLLASCSKKNNRPEGQDGQSILISDLPGDTSATMADGGNNSFKNMYFSFTANEAVHIGEDDKKSLRWDLAFTGPYNAEIYVNSAANPYNPGYEGTGKGAIVQIDQPYDQVVTAPSDESFDASAVTKIGWDAGNGTGWFFYSLANHICVPIRNRTFVLRTAGGKYAKLEMINVYKGNPPVVTDLFWPAPYFTFRYYVQQDGSRNLQTK